MQSVSVRIVRSDDHDLIAALREMAKSSQEGIKCSEFNFTFLSDESIKLDASQLENSKDLDKLSRSHARVFRTVQIMTNRGRLIIQRHGNQPTEDNPEPVDLVKIQPDGNIKALEMAEFVGFAYTHLARFSTSSLTTLLGKDAQKHYEARDAALAHLESLVASLTHDLEAARISRDSVFSEKEKRLELHHQEKEAQLNATIEKRQKELDDREAQLEEYEAGLNLQAAKAERRQVRKELKSTLQSWSETFEITPTTKKLRVIIHLLCITLLAIFGAAAGVLLYHSTQAVDTVQFIVLSVKQGIATALFVATTIFYAKWNTHWFQRRANEEFRLKRMELDFDRASWFVELVFQWKEDFKDEPIPPELVQRLTSHLFEGDPTDHPPQHPYETLGSALLGATAKLKFAGSGAEIEFDRKGIRQLRKESE